MLVGSRANPEVPKDIFQDYDITYFVSDMIGIQTDVGVSAGKMGKYYKEYLPAELYKMYDNTYSNSDYDDIWEAVFTACELFRKLSNDVADFFGYVYNEREEAFKVLGNDTEFISFLGRDDEGKRQIYCDLKDVQEQSLDAPASTNR